MSVSIEDLFGNVETSDNFERDPDPQRRALQQFRNADGASETVSAANGVATFSDL